MKKHILVTGGAGAIGSNLVHLLARDPNNQVTVLDNMSSGHAQNIGDFENVRLVQGSVESDEHLNLVFSAPIQVIFHLAANFANQNSVDFPQRDLEVNGMGTLKLLLRAKEFNVDRFVYTSSSCVYGNRDEPLDEKFQEYSLDTPYGITKLLGERYVHFFAKHHGMKTVILRYFNVFGNHEYPGKYRNVIANFFYNAMNNEDLVITGTGEESRDFNFVEDSVRATAMVAEKDEAIGKTFNIASGKETKIKDLVEMILKISGSKSKVVYKPRRDWDSVTKRVAAVYRAKEVLGYEPQISVEEGLKKYYEWLKKQTLTVCEW